MNERIRVWLVVSILLYTSAILLSVNPLEAQVQFVTPDKIIDLSKYSTFEECVSLKRRLDAREKRNLAYWKDSLKYTSSDKLIAASVPVRDTLAMCMAKFSPDNVNYSNYTEYLDWITIFYEVGRLEDANVVIEKKLSSTRGNWNKGDSARHPIPPILIALEHVRPLPWNDIVRIAKMVDSPEESSLWETKIKVYGSLLRLADEINDTIVQRYAAEKAVELERSLTQHDKASYFWEVNGQYTVMQALEFIHNNEMLDSLRVGAKSYLSVRKSYWNKIRGSNSDNLPDNAGETAKPIVADFWFRRVGDTIVRLPNAPGTIPEPGSINLIVFLEIRCAASTPTFRGRYHRSFPVSGSCLPSYSVIRRLAESYPSLRVTIVSMTDGFIGLTAPMSPEEEAVHKSQWWLGTFRLPATLAVAEQKFFKLPDPDGRRVDEIHDNTNNYLFNRRETRVPTGTAFLIDIDGTILYSVEITPKTERQFDQLLKVIVNRRKASDIHN